MVLPGKEGLGTFQTCQPISNGNTLHDPITPSKRWLTACGHRLALGAFERLRYMAAASSELAATARNMATTAATPALTGGTGQLRWVQASAFCMWARMAALSSGFAKARSIVASRKPDLLPQS